MRQDTIHHATPTPEVPQAATAAEEPQEEHVLVEKSTTGGRASADTTRTRTTQQKTFEEAFNPNVSLWEQDTLATSMNPVISTDSMPSLTNTFFSNSRYTTEQQAGRYGMAGDPVPYNIRTDSILTSVIIISTLMMVYSVGKAQRFFVFHIKNFFRTMRHDSSLAKEAASDVRNLFFIIMYGVIVLSLVFFFYTKEYIASTFITNSEYALMGIFLAEVTAYVFGEILLQNMVNKVFFSKAECGQWITTKLLLYSLAGIALTPLFLLMSFFGLGADNSVVYALVITFFVKILSFYKAFSIFFKKIGNCLQFFLYLCTLEIIPTLLIGGILLLTANYLKVNY